MEQPAIENCGQPRQDDTGHPLGESGGTSGYQQETVWFNGQPVATVMGGNTFYAFADNLGSPRSLVQASNNAEVWRWDSDPFGTAAPSGQVTYNMRFPGQVADIETGLFQNGFRDYVGINTPWTMPNLGRYCAQCIQPKNRS